MDYLSKSWMIDRLALSTSDVSIDARYICVYVAIVS